MATNLVLLLAVVSAGSGGTDIVFLLPAKDYFASRNINPTIDNLVELAGTAPTSGKKQIAQLLALRQLAVDAESVKKSPKLPLIRALLEQLALGKKANDTTGFAADYAKRALAALGGPKHERPIAASWRKGADWIPDTVNFFVSFGSGPSMPGDQQFLDTTPFLAQMPKAAREEMFNMIEKIGNVRVDRVVWGWHQRQNSTFEAFVRVTGKVNPDWVVEGLVETFKGAKLEERKGESGLPIRVVRPFNHHAIAVVGDTDLLLADGGPGPRVREGVASVSSLDKMFALAAKPGADVTEGVLKTDLARIRASASCVIVGDVPSGFGGLVGPYPMPLRLFAHAQMTAKGLDVQIQATMEDKDNAKKLAQTAGQGRNAALAQLAKLQGQPPPFPGFHFDSMNALLRSVEMRSEGSTLHARLLLLPDTLVSLAAYLFVGR